MSLKGDRPKEDAIYKNPGVNVEKRVEDLLSHMTLDEKICQLVGIWNKGVDDFEQDILDDEDKMNDIFKNGIHTVHSAFKNIEDTVTIRNQIQKYLVEKTRLGIPALFIDEGQHGLMKQEATVFPQAIGMACSWNPGLLEKVYSVVAHETRSRGGHMVFSPMIDVCREPRWGRVEECYGEDPFLNSQYAVAAVKGFQGSTNGSIAKNHVAATIKHFVGHGEPEGGINQAPANFSQCIVRDIHMPPFKKAVEVKPAALMPSYNEIDGIPSHINTWLLKDILRKEWKYEGMVVSDFFAIDHVHKKHCAASDEKDAAMKCFNAGIQYEFPFINYYKHLPELLEEGKIKTGDIDKAVSQVLKLKFELGLFENPYIDIKQAFTVSKKETHKALALQIAQESIVLLKNEDILPLRKNKYKKIAVIGPCAGRTFFGGYSGEPYETVTILDGIKNKVGTGTEVLYAEGVQITENISISHLHWKLDDIVMASARENRKRIKAAVEIAKEAEIIILAIGENEHLCREAWDPSHVGDNNTLDLLCQQEDLVKAMVALKKPVVVYLMNGRPLSVNYIKNKVPAIIEGWYMGQETGTAVADILFGDINPSGKLTITIPKSVGQLPLYYNHKPSAQYQNYISQDIKPLFPFGYGLSYTTFSYSTPVLNNSIIKSNESVKLEVEVKNTGKVTGDEIVQLYIRDLVGSVTRPVKELKGFRRISLQPGESKKVIFDITPEMLSFWNTDMKFCVEAGDFEIMVGSSSLDEDLQKVILQVNEE